MDGYKHDRVERISKDNEHFKVFNSLSKGFEGIVIFNRLFELLDDRNPILKTISDKNVEGLVNFVGKFYTASAWFIMQESNLKKLVTKGHRKLYKVNVAGRLRVATAQEVENGVRGLKYEFQSPLTQDKIKLLYLLLWAVTGNDFFYYESGNTFDREAGELKIYKQIASASASLNGLMNWMNESEQFSTDMQLIRDFGKKKYNYPEYETDEIFEELSRKQLLYSLNNSIPPKSENPSHKKALGWIIKEQKNKYYTIEPERVSAMREIYAEIQENGEEKRKSNPEVEKACKTLLDAKTSGLLTGNEFAFKIVESLGKTNYAHWTEKQYKVISEELDKLEKKKVIEEEEEDTGWYAEPSDLDRLVEEYQYRETSLTDMSSALGDGDLN